MLRKKAERLSLNVSDLERGGRMLLAGKIGAITFNGIYGLFTNSENQDAARGVLKIKDRPEDKNLILTADPRNLIKDEQIDLADGYYTHDQIIGLQTKLHALGIILPAGRNAPRHLITNNTILNIWTEYDPLKTIMEEYRKLGGRALAGTSANKRGAPTIHDTGKLWEVFGNEVDFIIEADHSNHPISHKSSTSIIDLTQKRPRLHRLGSVSVDEIKKVLEDVGIEEELLVSEHTVVRIT